MKVFKIRAHAAGQICAGDIGLTEKQQERYNELYARTLPGAKPLTDKMQIELGQLIHKRDNPQLPQTAKNYCEQWLKEQIYGKRYGFTSKFTDKGNAVELTAFEMIGKYFNSTFQKNDEFFENDFTQGIPDIIDVEQGILIDAKSSWDCFSFPYFDTEPDINYFYQLQAYMALTGVKTSKLIYCLCDTPEKIIQQEAKRACLNNGFDVTPEAMAEWTEQLTYGNVDESYKIKVFEIARNEDAINKIIDRVTMCRNYIKTLVA